MGPVIDTMLAVSSVASAARQQRVQQAYRIAAVAPLQSDSPDTGAARHARAGVSTDQGTVLRSTVVGQYVRMAQDRGPAVAARPVAVDQGLPPNGDATNLRRDVLQTFLEHMGGVKASGAGGYFKLRV